MISRAKERPLWLRGVSEERRKAIGQAFDSKLVVEELDTIRPILYVRGELPGGSSDVTGEFPSDEKGFRATIRTESCGSSKYRDGPRDLERRDQTFFLRRNRALTSGVC